MNDLNNNVASCTHNSTTVYANTPTSSDSNHTTSITWHGTTPTAQEQQQMVHIVETYLGGSTSDQ